MNLQKVEFLISAAAPKDFPKTRLPEIAFAGKSNVGKSSVINRLLQRKNFARVGEKPGKTIHVNYFTVDKCCYFVDLPGYGFAKRSKSVQQKLTQMINSYILQREQLVNTFVLVDIRHEQQKIDREFIDWLGQSGVPFAIIFTKADKLGPVRARQNAEAWMRQLADTWEELPPYFITSSENRTGRDEVLNYIEQINSSLNQEEKA